jgi:hypothetical protein
VSDWRNEDRPDGDEIRGDEIRGDEIRGDEIRGDEIDERLADWVDGRLSERDRERFEAELRVSPQLRERVDEYERTVQSVRAASATNG